MMRREVIEVVRRDEQHSFCENHGNKSIIVQKISDTDHFKMSGLPQETNIGHIP